MTEKQFLKLVNPEKNKLKIITYSDVYKFLNSEKKEENFLEKISRKLKGNMNTSEKIVGENIKPIFEMITDGDTFSLLRLLLKNKQIRPILEKNIEVVLKKVMSNSKDLEIIYKLLSENNLLGNNIDFIIKNNPDMEHIFILANYEKEKSKENDEKIENCFKNRKLEFSKYLLERKIKSSNEKLMNDFSLTTSTLIEELLESEKARYIDIKYIGRGSFSNVYKIKDKVIKIGEERETYQIPNHRRILQPLLRTRLIDEENNFNIGYIEITDRVEAIYQREKNVDKLYELYKELRESGIIWTDVRFENVGKLIKDNIPNLNGEKMYVSFNSVGFSNELTSEKTLKKGDWVILDTDFIYKEDEEKISWASDGYGLDFEYRYKKEKNPNKRKEEIKKFVEELDFEDR